MGFIIGILLFSIPATIIAAKKGFAPLRWMLSLGIIGLGFVIYLPSASAEGISPDEKQQKARRADKLGAKLAWINLGLDVIGMTVSFWSRISADEWDFAVIPIVLLAAAYLAAERIVAFRWLVADTNARQTSFSLWAFLTLVFPVLGLSLYLFFRPKNNNVPRWRLSQKAIVPLAAVAAMLMTSYGPLIGYYHIDLGMPALKLVLTAKILLAIAVSISSWYMARAERATWQDNPLILISGLLLAMAIMFFHPPSYAGFILEVLISAVGLVSVISALTYLCRFELFDVARGLVAGYILAMVLSFVVAPSFGAGFASSAVILGVGLPMAYVAYLSAEGALVTGPQTEKRAHFLEIALPFWGLLIFQLLVFWIRF